MMEKSSQLKKKKKKSKINTSKSYSSVHSESNKMKHIPHGWLGLPAHLANI